MKCISADTDGEEDIFVNPYSIESVRPVVSSGGRHCLIRMKSGDELRCGHSAVEFIEGLKRTLDEMMGHSPCRS
jgi:hypothetical protein